MSETALKEAAQLARKLGHIFVATADERGRPHVAAAAGFAAPAPDRVKVSAWFCPGTVNNLAVNRQIALVVWDPGPDIGYQLCGEMEKMEEIAVLDGYGGEAEMRGKPVPQVERQIVVRVDRVLAFTHAPHTDVAE